MQRRTIQSTVIAALLLLLANLSLAAESKPGTPADTKAISGSKTAAEKTSKGKDVKAGDAKASAKIKLVDINSAGKQELKALSGVGDAEADKIIAGRPYLTKAHLVTHNILTPEVYEGLKKLVIAKQKQQPSAKPGAK